MPVVEVALSLFVAVGAAAGERDMRLASTAASRADVGLKPSWLLPASVMGDGAGSIAEGGRGAWGASISLLCEEGSPKSESRETGSWLKLWG